MSGGRTRRGGGGRSAARAGGRGKGAAAPPAEDPLFPARPRNFRIGGDIRPTKDLSRFVKWPRNVRIQRQRKVLLQRIKVPPTLNQFRRALDRAEASPIFTLLKKYSPETPAQKKERMEAQAKAKAAGAEVDLGPKPKLVKFGLNHVTTLIEQSKALLVVIAADVDPIELVAWMPALCRMKDIPYVIVNNKGRLGQVVHQKKAACVALTDVEDGDRDLLDKICEDARSKFNDNVEIRRKWGGGIVGLKTKAKLEQRRKVMEAEAAKRAQVL